MSAKVSLFLSVLRAFEKEGLLGELVLIGSWTHTLYAEHFNNPPEIPATRTLDLDFMVSEPRRVTREVDIPAVLKRLDFTEKVDPNEGVIKYEHPDLELELLAPLKGTADKKPIPLPKLKTTAQRLRYLDVLDATITVLYKGLKVKVPEPSAYVLQKILIHEDREPAKKKKDLEAIQGISQFLLKDSAGQKRLRSVYSGLILGWQKKILKFCEVKVPELHRFLKGV